MGSIFDGLKNNAFDITTNIIGYDASWTPTVEEDVEPLPTLSAKVHFRKPDEKDVMRDGVEYAPSSYFMEYRVPFFPGLYESVRFGGTEIVTVDGTQYYARQATRVNDGDTILINMEKV